MRTRLNLVGHQVTNIDLNITPTIYFDGSNQHTLCIDGPFTIHEHDTKLDFEPPFKDWELATCMCLLGKRVVLAKFTSSGELLIDFDGGLSLYVPDGPYENWSLHNRSQILHGGCGTMA